MRSRLNVARRLHVLDALAAIIATLLIAGLICAGGAAMWILGTVVGP